MNPIDAIVLLLLFFGVISDARAGLLGPVLGLVGATAGAASPARWSSCAQIRRGSGGEPLVVAPGVVGAVVFGASPTSAKRRIRDRRRQGGGAYRSVHRFDRRRFFGNPAEAVGLAGP